MMGNILNIFKKKVSVGIMVSVVCVSGAVVYSLGYMMAMKKLNNVISYTQEKQKMYSKLSEIDYNIRGSYIGNLDEKKIYDGICKGYVDGIDDKECVFFSPLEYKMYVNELESLTNDVSVSNIGSDIGIIKCSCMCKNFSADFINALNSLMLDGKDKIIIDIRDSKNSLETEIFKVLEYMSPPGDIVKVVDKEDVETVVCSSTTAGVKVKLAVIVNEETYGNSEVFASSLKDSCGAKVIGNTTAGCAARKKVANLSDSSVVLFPDAYYLSSGMNNIFKKGFEPDIVVLNDDESDKQLDMAVNYLKNE